MVEKNEKKWDRVEGLSRTVAQKPDKTQVAEAPAGALSLAHPDVPKELSVASLGQFKEFGLDIISKYKVNKIGRKAYLEELQTSYNSKLEVIRETLAQAVKVQNTKVAVVAEEYLKILDAKHLEVLTELGLRNADKRWKSVMALTDLAVAKINEVQGKDWPESLINDTISQILALRTRVAREITDELKNEAAKG